MTALEEYISISNAMLSLRKKGRPKLADALLWTLDLIYDDLTDEDYKYLTSEQRQSEIERLLNGQC